MTQYDRENDRDILMFGCMVAAVLGFVIGVMVDVWQEQRIEACRTHTEAVR